MSGHSKWATIKHKKATTDARRGKLFSKILKEITVAARLGGGDPKGNPRLRSAVLEARSNSVPMDNIDRAIKKGTGELESEVYEEVIYEGYGPAGVAILVEAATDNRNRTTGEIRHTFARNNGSLGEAGCVAWMFHRRGYFAVEKSVMDEEKFMELALDLNTQDELERRGVPTAAHELAMVPQTTIGVPADKVNQVLRLMEALEDHDDVQKVWANLDVDEKVLAAQASR
jgi:YebC/PmpR family DNA-binding regulatory protein